MSFVASKIQQTCTGTGNDNSKSTKQGMNHTMEGLCTKHLSFSLLAKNFKKRSFEARSDKHSCYILG